MEVRVYDPRYNVVGYANDYQSCTAQETLVDKGSAQVVLSADHRLAGYLALAAPNKALGRRAQRVPITISTDTLWWTGKVSSLAVAGETGNQTLTVTCVDDKAVLEGIRGWPNPFLGILAQISTTLTDHDQRGGPLETVVKAYVQANVGRLGFPLVVVPALNPDPSPHVDLAARMDDLYTFLSAPLKANNMGLSCKIWVPGRPQPTGLSLSTPTFYVDVITPRTPTYVQWTERNVSTVELNAAAAAGSTAITGGKTNSWLLKVAQNLGIPLPADVFVAYDQFTDVDAATAQGPFEAPEVYVSGGDGSFSLSSRQEGIAELVKHAGSRTAKITVTDGSPWTYEQDYARGDYVSYSHFGDVYTDQITQVDVADDATAGLTVTPTIGPFQAVSDPDRALWQALASFFNKINLQT